MEQRGPIPMDQEKHKLLLQQFKQPSKSPTMDDDIDIEEHDVLDNPRIKSIFPDLSRVKIEVPDDEEELVEEQYGILDPTEEPQDMQYQYEYSFETADDMPEEFVQDGSQEELEEDGEDEENGYFYDNQIILGSKPSPDFELLYEEALTSQPIVYLENWEDRLKSSPCFCDTCEILFPTVNALDAHKMISHSYLVAMDMPQKNTARKSTATSKYCNHCAKTFPDDTSLIKHLYELLPLNNFSKVKEEKIEPDNSKKKFSTSVPWPKKIKIEPREVKIEPLEKDVKPKLKGTKHMGIHSFPNEDYKIKVIEPDTGKVLYLTGNNRVKDDGNTDSRRSKRRSEMSEETSPIKKPRTSLRELDTPLSERKSSRRIIAKASTSRDSGMEFDDTPNQISVPDEISIHDNVNNVTDTDIDTSDMISPGKNNDTLDKNGLSSRLKSRIIVKGYGRELYKCDHCNLHYMKKESYVYHFNRNPGPHEFADKFKCEICDLEFSKHTLPRHKYVHHDNMGLKKEDFIILTDVLSNEQETSEEIKVENVSEVLDTSTEVVSENDSINNTKVLSDVNVSDNIDTEILSDVNNSDNFDAEIVSEINNSDNIDAEIHSEIINSDNCDAKNLSGVNVSDICDTNSENVSKVSSDVNISDTEILSDVNS
ncbi:hypothetical protein PYW07_012815 [Mythimna separata]|uniref:C2H2-type domain-containing protein n=1 Tax=Mythimna separata TaxID=271217 RepID=A0AAD7Y8X5_MYTSE|nr:hypothetical protein PYW07_012815 [Mythimna separata]